MPAADIHLSLSSRDGPRPPPQRAAALAPAPLPRDRVPLASPPHDDGDDDEWEWAGGDEVDAVEGGMRKGGTGAPVGSIGRFGRLGLAWEESVIEAMAAAAAAEREREAERRSPATEVEAASEDEGASPRVVAGSVIAFWGRQRSDLGHALVRRGRSLGLASSAVDATLARPRPP